MSYNSLDDIYAAMDNAQARFVSAVSVITDAQANFRPADNAWTIAEIAEHLAITNNGFLRITHKLLKEADTAGAGPLAGLAIKSVLLLPDGTQPPPVEAPERVKPHGTQPLAESLTKLTEALAGFHEIKPRLLATDCSAPTFPHPAVGPLNAYQWMIVQAEHLDRHRGQAERIQRSPAYPAA
jgi:hypothetical protein